MFLADAIIDLNGDGKLEGIEVFLTDIILASLLVGAMIALFRALRGINKLLKRINNFFDDWYGTSEPGEAQQPGVLARLVSLEDTRRENLGMLKEIADTLTVLKEQIQKELDQGTSSRVAAEEAMCIAKEIQAAQEEAARVEARWFAKYLHDQNEMRREWASILEVVNKMIGKPPEDQLALWQDVIDSYNAQTVVINRPPEGEPK